MLTRFGIIATLLLCCTSLQGQVTAIKAGRLVDTESGTVLNN